MIFVSQSAQQYRTSMELKTHGGKRANSGRQKEGKIKVCITMTPAHYAATAGNRSATIEHALTKMFEDVESLKHN